MPPIPHTSPSTGHPTPPSYIHTTSFSFVDTRGRTLLLRGVNLSGASKAPVGQLSHVLDGFWEGGQGGVVYPDDDDDGAGQAYWDASSDSDDSASVSSSCSSASASASAASSSSSTYTTQNGKNARKPRKLSFVGRPLNLEDGSADVHLARLRGWGFNLLRFPFTWEGLEHEGPGKYDYEYMDYIIKCLLKCKEYGFRVYMDPHQDTWSRFSGGSGAPYWTLPACGINPRHITATQAALLHCEYPTTYYPTSSSSSSSPSSSKTGSPRASSHNLHEKHPSTSSPSQDPNPSPSPSSDPPEPTGPDPASLPAMSWSTNYGRLLSQTVFTLFFAGRDFAPLCVLDGVNIQDWLQARFLRACGELARRIGEWDRGVRERGRAERRRRRARDGDNDDDIPSPPIEEEEGEEEYPDTLLDTCVIGWDSLNEPFEGLCGWADLSVNPTEQGSTLKKGTYPTPIQSMRLGMGFSERVEHWSFGAMGPRRDGWVEVDPKGRKVWVDVVCAGDDVDAGADATTTAPADVTPNDDDNNMIPGELPDGTHTVYGWKRDVARWKLGTCIWAQHGVWDVPTGYLLRPDYFAHHPSTGHEVEFLTDYWKPFFLAYARAVRAHHPEAIVFVQPPVFAVPPRFSEEELRGRAAYSPHYYDGLTLVTRHWNWFNADALGLLRGKYRSALGAVKIGEGAIRKSLHEQLGYLQADVAALPPPPSSGGGGGGGGEDPGDDGSPRPENEGGGGGGDDGDEARGSPLGGKNTRGYPTLIGEIGTPFDMDGKRSYGWTDGGKHKGDYSNQERALDASLQACDAWIDKKEKAEWEKERKEREKGKIQDGGGEEELSNRTLKGDSLNWTLWTYVPDDHSHEWGDGWNMEDLSLFSVDDLEHSDEEYEDDDEEDVDEDDGGWCEECEECLCDDERERGEQGVGVDEDGGVVDAEERGRLGLGEEGVYREMHSLPRGSGRGRGRGRRRHREPDDDKEEALHSRAGLLMEGEREADLDQSSLNIRNQGESCGQRLRRCCRHHLHRGRRRDGTDGSTKFKDKKSTSKSKSKFKSKSKSKQQQQQQQPVKSLPMTLSSLSVASRASSTGLGLGAVDIHRRRGRKIGGGGGGAMANGNGIHPSVVSVVSSVTRTSSTRTRTYERRRRHHHHHQHHHHHHHHHHTPKANSQSTPNININSIPLPLLKAGYHPNPYTFLTNGARAVRAFARPWPVAVVGRAVDVRFDVAKGVFKLVVWVGWEDEPVVRKDWGRRDGMEGGGEEGKEESVATEVYLPLVHYAHPRLLVEDGQMQVQEGGGNGYGYGYPPGPVSAAGSRSHSQAHDRPSPNGSASVNHNNDGSVADLESSVATLAPAHLKQEGRRENGLPALMTTTGAGARGTALMNSSPPSPALESPVKEQQRRRELSSSGVLPPPRTNDTLYPPRTTLRALLLIRDSPVSSSTAQTLALAPLIDVEVTLSSGRYEIRGQKLLWWYDVPKKGEGRREYVLTVKRRGGVLASPEEGRVRRGREREKERERKEKERQRAYGEEGEDEKGCWESLCDEQGCVIA